MDTLRVPVDPGLPGDEDDEEEEAEEEAEAAGHAGGFYEESMAAVQAEAAAGAAPGDAQRASARRALAPASPRSAAASPGARETLTPPLVSGVPREGGYTLSRYPFLRSAADFAAKSASSVLLGGARRRATATARMLKYQASPISTSMLFFYANDRTHRQKDMSKEDKRAIRKAVEMFRKILQFQELGAAVVTPAGAGDGAAQDSAGDDEGEGLFARISFSGRDSASTTGGAGGGADGEVERLSCSIKEPVTASANLSRATSQRGAKLAEVILTMASESQGLVDEFYVQVMKQVSDTPDMRTASQGWKLFCVGMGCLLPSRKLTPFLQNFLEKRARGAPHLPRVHYARYASRALEGALEMREPADRVHGVHAPQDEVYQHDDIPTYDILMHYDLRPPMLVCIELPGGEILVENLPVPPNLNVKEVMAICQQWLEFDNLHAQFLALFAYDDGPVDRHRGPSAGAHGVMGGETGLFGRRGNSIGVGPEPPVLAPRQDLPSSGLLQEDWLRPYTTKHVPRLLGDDEFLADVLLEFVRARRTLRFVLKQKLFVRADKWYMRPYYYPKSAMSTADLLYKAAPVSARFRIPIPDPAERLSRHRAHEWQQQQRQRRQSDEDAQFDEQIRMSVAANTNDDEADAAASIAIANRKRQETVYSRLLYLQAVDDVLTRSAVPFTSRTHAVRMAVLRGLDQALGERGHSIHAVDADVARAARDVGRVRQNLDRVTNSKLTDAEIQRLTGSLSNDELLIGSPRRDVRWTFVLEAFQLPLFGAHLFRVIIRGCSATRDAAPYRRLSAVAEGADDGESPGTSPTSANAAGHRSHGSTPSVFGMAEGAPSLSELPSRTTMCIDIRGITFWRGRLRDLMRFISIHDVIRWWGSPHRLSLDCYDYVAKQRCEMELISPQAADIGRTLYNHAQVTACTASLIRRAERMDRAEQGAEEKANKEVSRLRPTSERVVTRSPTGQPHLRGAATNPRRTGPTSPTAPSAAANVLTSPRTAGLIMSSPAMSNPNNGHRKQPAAR